MSLIFDSTTIKIGQLANGGSLTPFTFAPTVSKSLRILITATSKSTNNVGLSEVQVYGAPVQVNTKINPKDKGKRSTIQEQKEGANDTKIVNGRVAYSYPISRNEEVQQRMLDRLSWHDSIEDRDVYDPDAMLPIL